MASTLALSGCAAVQFRAVTGLVALGVLSPGSDQPLHSAATSGDLRAVRSLVEADADLNAKGLFGRTPLYYAALSDQPQVLAYLLQRGADPKKGASWKGDDTPLHVAAENGHVACVKILLAAKVPVDIKNSANQTPLHLAAREQQVNAVRILIAHGADVNGETALHEAVYRSEAAVVELLLKRGTDPNIAAIRDPPTPLAWAQKKGHTKIVALLVKYGAKK